MREWIDVATLVKTKNLKGRFVARPATNLPFLLQEGMRVAFVPPQTDLPRGGAVVFAGEIDGRSCEVGFDSVCDEATAHGLVGCHCLVKRADVGSFSVEDEPAAWVGWCVVDEGGASIGEVVALTENPAHPLLEVERPDGHGVASIPVVEEFIVAVDEDSRTVTVNLPAGLLDL